MSKGSKKGDSDLKSKYQLIEGEEWIQMDDLRAPQNHDISKKFAEEGIHFAPINESSLRSSQIRQESRDLKRKDPPLIDLNNIDKARPSQSTVSGYKGIENVQPKKVKKPSIPMMQVTCDFCTVMQNVPGNTQVYICGSCENMNECYPLYAAFICGCCQSKVCYGFGTSEHIRCPKCSTVNKVPFEPSKKYLSQEKPNESPDQRRRREQRHEKQREIERLRVQRERENERSRQRLWQVEEEEEVERDFIRIEREKERKREIQRKAVLERERERQEWERDVERRKLERQREQRDQEQDKEQLMKLERERVMKTHLLRLQEREAISFRMDQASEREFQNWQKEHESEDKKYKYDDI